LISGIFRILVCGNHILQFRHPDPLDPDTDDDGLTDGQEAGLTGIGTNPLNPDTDGSGTNDGTEVANGTDPTPAVCLCRAHPRLQGCLVAQGSVLPDYVRRSPVS